MSRNLILISWHAPQLGALSQAMSAPPPTIAERRFAVPLALLLALSAASLVLTVAVGALSLGSLSPLTEPLAWLDQLELADALDVLSNAAEVVAAVLAIAVTVVAIVVELAANRYSHEITRVFLREPVNLLVLGLYVLTTLQCLWVGAFMESGMAGREAASAIPHAGFAITVTMVTISLLVLLPYIYFVFTILSPVNVIQRIHRDAYRVILRVDERNIARSQARVEESVDKLQDVARSAISQGDRSIAMAAVESMAGLVLDYARVRDRLPAAWFRITESIASDPDFVALAPEVMHEVETQGVWLERKVFRRFLSLMGQSATHARDVANVIGMSTERIAVALAATQPAVLTLCQRAFNSYLRTTINARDARTSYVLMNQYRLLAERVLSLDLADETVRVARFLGEYGQIAHKSGLSFLLETAAYDVSQLIEQALKERSEALDPLLDCLLELDLEIREEQQEESLLGVRRAQMQLATLFLQSNDEARATRIIDDLRGERPERLERLRQGLMTDDRSQFWEIMDRGVNFGYLAPDRRPFLQDLFDRIHPAERREAT